MAKNLGRINQLKKAVDSLYEISTSLDTLETEIGSFPITQELKTIIKHAKAKMDELKKEK